MNVIPPHAWFWLAPLVAWSAVWKGIALWKAARNDSLPWFVVMLVINTAGILEIVYILAFSRKAAKPQAPAAP